MCSRRSVVRLMVLMFSLKLNNRVVDKNGISFRRQANLRVQLEPNGRRSYLYKGKFLQLRLKDFIISFVKLGELVPIFTRSSSRLFQLASDGILPVTRWSNRVLT